MDITDFIRQVAQLEKEQDAIYRSVAAKERGAFLLGKRKKYHYKKNGEAYFASPKYFPLFRK